MKLTGLHLLLTYQCTHECDHCFVWGSPFQSGVMTLDRVRTILGQAGEHRSVEWIYFEGGEAFLYYPVLRKGVELAKESGFRVGVVSNGYWATGPEDAAAWLKPLAGRLDDLSVSKDSLHGNENRADLARAAAQKLGIPTATVTTVQPGAEAWSGPGRIPAEAAAVRFRGRAARELTLWAPRTSGRGFTCCPYEDLRNPGRVHVDPFGNVHVCQGIVIGNLLEHHLNAICASYLPDRHPVTGPLLSGGPAELARRYDLAYSGAFADACHLCYDTRTKLRGRFPKELGPDQMYGVVSAS